MDDPCDPCIAFLRPNELPIIAVMSDGKHVFPATYVADDLGCDVELVRATHKRMVNFGFARTGPLFSEDDGKLAGRGTWLIRPGFFVQDIVRQAGGASD